MFVCNFYCTVIYAFKVINLIYLIILPFLCRFMNRLTLFDVRLGILSKFLSDSKINLSSFVPEV